MTEQSKCELCGEPMPQGEEMFKIHGYSGPCPKPPIGRDDLPEAGDLRFCMICSLEKPWGVYDGATGAAVCIDCRDKARA